MCTYLWDWFETYYQGICDGHWAQAGFNGMTNMLSKQKNNATSFLKELMSNRLLPYCSIDGANEQRPLIETAIARRFILIKIYRTALKARIMYTQICNLLPPLLLSLDEVDRSGKTGDEQTFL